MLRTEGYTLDFELIDGELRHEEACVSCRADEAVVEKLYRFEGPSDPGDEMIVLGVRDPASGLGGVVASAYGSAADPVMLDHLTGLATRFPGS